MGLSAISRQTSELFMLEVCDDDCLGTMVSLLISLRYASLQLPLENRENKNSRMSVWAKFAKISSRENFYLYSIPLDGTF